jgi:hypothetical protein
VTPAGQWGLDDPDVWAAHLWPWLSAAHRCAPRYAAAMARILVTRVDTRDLTVDLGADYGLTAHTRTKAVARLIAAGLLAPTSNGRARLTLPE